MALAARATIGATRWTNERTMTSRGRARASDRRARGAVVASGKIDFTDAGCFELPYAPVAEALLPEGPWKVVEGGVCAAKGFKVAGYKAGLRATGTRADCALIVADEDATCAGIFTTNIMCAAPVKNRFDQNDLKLSLGPHQL